MKIIEKIIDFPNDNWGEDRIFSNKNMIGIIDGSTPIYQFMTCGYHSQAEWFVDKLVQKLSADSTNSSFPQLCQKSVNQCKNEKCFTLMTEYNQPCAVLSVIQVRNNKVFLYSIGDCSIILKYKNNKMITVTDKRIVKYSCKTKEARNYAISHNVNPKSAIIKQLIENKKSMNIPNGYWTVSFKNNFENEFITLIDDYQDLDECLICSDGFARLFESTHISIDDIFAKKYTLKECLSLLRSQENKQPYSLEVKKHDDASAVLLSF